MTTNKSFEYAIVHTCDNCNEDIYQEGIYFGQATMPVIHMQSMGQTEFYCDTCDITWAYGDIDYVNVDEL